MLREAARRYKIHGYVSLTFPWIYGIVFLLIRIQAVVISIFSHYVMKKHPIISSGIGVAIGAIIMIVGYSLGRAFIYSTPEYAILKLPYQILQAVVGAIMGMVLCWKCGIYKVFRRTVGMEEIKQKSYNI